MTLRLVADGGRLLPQAIGGLTGDGQDRVRTPAPPAARQAAIQQPDRAPRPARLRLTRRGRMVVTAAAVLTIGAASMALAGAAQATGHSGAQAARAGVIKVVIRPGQSLWSVAEAYDPNADTRVVIQDIMQMNSLISDQVQPGQTIWVPRG